MSATLIDGTAIGAAIRASALPSVQAFTARAGRPPGLGIVLVGENPASEVYVRNKVRAGTEAGLWVDLQRLAATASLVQLLDLVARLNASSRHDGILVQSPLPEAMGRHAAQHVFDVIDPDKDVDGFHPVNVGKLVQGRAHLKPCTPSGVIEMLDRSGLAIAGRHAVVIGRSRLVGKPVAQLLLARDATVTMCHSKTPDLPAVARTADVLVVAAGRAGLVGAAHVKPGTAVVDVGINRRPDGSLAGDVDFAAVAEIAGAITPVPGGVGPTTVAMLMRNTVRACRRQVGA